LVYANKAAALFMSVVVEEMLHLSLSSNVKQAILGPPYLMKAGKDLKYPTSLFGNSNEFKINIGPLSINQLIVCIRIERPNGFKINPITGKPFDTIRDFYDSIIVSVTDDFAGVYSHNRPQLVSSQPYYSQNSINTVYYDEGHKPKFPSDADSGRMIEVKRGLPTNPIQRDSAVETINEILEQEEGKINGTQLDFDEEGKPTPLMVIDGKVKFRAGDYDDQNKNELSHFAKFLELYSLGLHYQKEFASHTELDNFFDYFVYNQAVNPISKDYYPDTDELYQMSQLTNTIYTYILLMIETGYHRQLPTYYEVFMMGINKSIIWLLSEFGNRMYSSSYFKDDKSHQGGLTFEYYPFENQKDVRPKQQMINLARQLTDTDSETWGWLLTMPQYFLNLPGVGLDHDVKGSPML
jgi:hypothetical protein